MNLSFDDISNMNIAALGIDTTTKAGQKELMQFAFVEDALSEEDAIESMLYPHGRPSKWETFYNKWFAIDLTKTGGSPSYLMILTWIILAPFIWISHKQNA
jgi:hypothetical protein